MTDEKWPWRDFLKPDEEAEVQALDAEIESAMTAAQSAAGARGRLQIIRSRATQRAIRQRAG